MFIKCQLTVLTNSLGTNYITVNYISNYTLIGLVMTMTFDL